jgi:hypothetical protein
MIVVTLPSKKKTLHGPEVNWYRIYFRYKTLISRMVFYSIDIDKLAALYLLSTNCVPAWEGYDCRGLASIGSANAASWNTRQSTLSLSTLFRPLLDISQ